MLGLILGWKYPIQQSSPRIIHIALIVMPIVINETILWILKYLEHVRLEFVLELAVNIGWLSSTAALNKNYGI
jgi:hypothetical protein